MNVLKCQKGIYTSYKLYVKTVARVTDANT